MFLRYFIELSYNGKMYHGWQIQPDVISVQEVLEKALSLLLNQKIAVVGCGRTDTGVHASQFFLHFDILKKIEEKQFLFKLNAFLPRDISILKIFSVANTLHARFDAVSRSYEYRISLGKNPFYMGTTLQIRNKELDIKKMNEAAKILYNFENFKCFSKSKTGVKTYNCTITNANWIQKDTFLTFQITANRFLRNMVRAIVGTLLDVGTGKITVADFQKIIESKDRTQAGTSVKAHGLFLCQIIYPEKSK